MRKIPASSNVIAPLIALTLLISGCFSIEPTYTKEKISEAIISLCKKEYDIEPKVWLLGETVWIYLPLSRLVTKEVKLDPEKVEKINRVMMAAIRVVLSMKPRPQFMAVVASDIQEYGIDYTIINWIPDLVKYQLELISRDEFGRRNVVFIKENAQAISDMQGKHIEKKEIMMGDFLAEQIAQRIQTKFGVEPAFKDYFKVGKVEGVFKDNTFFINAEIEKLKNPPAGKIDLQKEMLKIIAYVAREYDFKDFLLVSVENPVMAEKTLVNRLSLKDFLKK